jgi:hypothetical protein
MYSLHRKFKIYQMYNVDIIQIGDYNNEKYAILISLTQNFEYGEI